MKKITFTLIFIFVIAILSYTIYFSKAEYKNLDINLPINKNVKVIASVSEIKSESIIVMDSNNELWNVEMKTKINIPYMLAPKEEIILMGYIKSKSPNIFIANKILVKHDEKYKVQKR